MPKNMSTAELVGRLVKLAQGTTPPEATPKFPEPELNLDTPYKVPRATSPQSPPTPGQWRRENPQPRETPVPPTTSPYAAKTTPDYGTVGHPGVGGGQFSRPYKVNAPRVRTSATPGGSGQSGLAGLHGNPRGSADIARTTPGGSNVIADNRNVTGNTLATMRQRSPAATVSPAAPGKTTSSSYQVGQMMRKQAQVKEMYRVYHRIFTKLAKRAGLTDGQIEGLEKKAGIEKEAGPFLTPAFMAALPWLLTALGFGATTYGVGRGLGWWDRPEVKAIKARLKAIQLARASGVNPEQLGILDPKKQQPATPFGAVDWSRFGSPGRAAPPGYMQKERSLQDLAGQLGLAQRHADAYRQLRQMPVYG